jgi:pyridoxal phosphate enzyme (YggS family)
MTGMATTRGADLAAGLATTRERIVRACRTVGRDPAQITLIVVTKRFPAADVITLAELGVRDVGENRHQEAEPKFAEAIRAGASITRHMIGQVQTNKAAGVAGYADVVHAVDRLRLVEALDRGLERAQRDIGVFVQVSLDHRPGRGGAEPDAVPELTAAVANSARMTLLGLMAVAPIDADPDDAFGHLAELAAAVRREHPQAAWLSAGMSGDLEAAIRHGATHLRVGTAILGSRGALR